jgi:hypothetical protein
MLFDSIYNLFTQKRKPHLLSGFLQCCLKVTAKPLVVGVFLFSLSGFIPPQKKIAVGEYEIKAVFLFNFAQFVEWPSEVLPEPNSPIIIGILGKDPFGPFLEETIEGEKINGRPIEIQRYTSVKQIKDCHILFIDPAVTPRLDNMLHELKGKEILTVSDGSNFIKQGGMVRFIKESNKIRLQINLSAVKASDITISSKLLRLSEIVEN